MQRWLSGRLVGVAGRRPCAKDADGTYRCRVVYAGGTRMIVWNPTRRVSIEVEGATYRQTADGTRTPIGSRTASVPVGFEPTLVVTLK